MNRPQIFRFIEKDYWAAKALADGALVRPEQIEAILGELEADWKDLTFKFYDDGSVTITDNKTEQPVSPSQLTGACYDFYVRKRIAQIRSRLADERQRTA